MHENPGQRLRHDGENAQRRGEDANHSGLGKCGRTFHGEAGGATPFGVGVLFGSGTRHSARCATPG